MASYKDYKSISAAKKAGSMYYTGKDGKKKLAVTKEQLDTWKTKVLAYRDVNGSELNVNTDHGSLVCNWGRVSDTYNGTSVWISP